MAWTNSIHNIDCFNFSEGFNRIWIGDSVDWSSNISEETRSHGEAEFIESGYPNLDRRVEFGCGSQCRFRCQYKISLSDCQKLNAEYRELKRRDLQWKYLLNLIQFSHNSNAIRRQTHVAYFLISNGERVKVCQSMFLNTFGETSTVIGTIKSKIRDSETNEVTIGDLRGKHRRKSRVVPGAADNSI
ncbi:hypothetical protein QAD02_022620 [Eretmocerus hayati]|uniref:Uncharacterized protein n=1 Tax=Eretmocerus hayati TaxID=131215 RepID=A0ACC2PTI3_9HYME|nr:hypothetical protein QAD02_022620 [Eretmocerus hayati]